MILLDTAALVRLVHGIDFRNEASDAIDAAQRSDELSVSVTSAWEIGLLATRTGRTARLIGDARLWFARAIAVTGANVLPVTQDIALDAVYLPEPFHRDPSDRWIVATARCRALSLVTSDRKIIAYARQGHVRAIRC